MYFHVIENVQRNGESCYELVRTYKRYKMLENYLLRTGKPVWVVESHLDHVNLPYRKNGSDKTYYGGFTASYWNTGGWSSALMPVLPML